MKKLLVATGATLSTLGFLSAAPAQAGTITFGYSADASVNVELNSLLAGNTIGGVTLPDNVSIIANDVTGNLTVLDDTAQFTDGDIELNTDVIDSVLDNAYEATISSFLGSVGLTSEQALQSADDIFNITAFTGDGTLTSQSAELASDPNNSSTFNTTYDNTNNSVSIDGYDTEVAESCLSATCELEGDVSFGISLMIGEFISFSTGLLTNASITLSQDTQDSLNTLNTLLIIYQISNPGTTSLELASVEGNFNVTTEKTDENAEGTEADVSVDVTGGSITGTTTVGGEETQILSLLFEDESGADSNVTQLSEQQDAQDVPEPSVLLGLLGSGAWVIKRKTRAIQINQA